MIVAKFGGTSVKDAKAMETSLAVVNSDKRIKVVVVSATSGTTNTLTELAEKARTKNWNEVQEGVTGLLEKHRKIRKELDLNDSVDIELKDLFDDCLITLKRINDEKAAFYREVDYLLGMGEKISSKLFSEQKLNDGRELVWFDVGQVMVTDDNFGKATPQLKRIKRCAQEKLIPILEKTNTVVVTQGFIGKSIQGDWTTLGREGSDYTAALLAEAIDANEIQIWTDVRGVYSFDPRKIDSATLVQRLAYKDALELSHFGAKVLHHSSLLPAIRANIPVHVGHSQYPGEGGTRIEGKASNDGKLWGVALRPKQELLIASYDENLECHDSRANYSQFLQNVFNVFSKFHLAIDLVTTSKMSVAIVIDESRGGTHLGAAQKSVTEGTDLISELNKISKVSIENGYSLVTLVGDMSCDNKILPGVFEFIQTSDVNFINLGTKGRSMGLLVKKEKAKELVEKLHQKFIYKDS